jgi:hypothetical protein
LASCTLILRPETSFRDDDELRISRDKQSHFPCSIRCSRCVSLSTLLGNSNSRIQNGDSFKDTTPALELHGALMKSQELFDRPQQATRSDQPTSTVAATPLPKESRPKRPRTVSIAGAHTPTNDCEALRAHPTQSGPKRQHNETIASTLPTHPPPGFTNDIAELSSSKYDYVSNCDSPDTPGALSTTMKSEQIPSYPSNPVHLDEHESFRYPPNSAHMSSTHRFHTPLTYCSRRRPYAYANQYYNLQSHTQLHIEDAGKTGTQNFDSLTLPTTRAPSEGTGLVRGAAIYLRVTHVALISSCPLLA